MWLSRKGAISARAGEWGLIPGSMGDGVLRRGRQGERAVADVLAARGRPEPLALGGAEAVHPGGPRRGGWPGSRGGRSDAFLDEHPDAYKPIDQVMADAADLVEVRHTLRQVVNVKGD